MTRKDAPESTLVRSSILPLPGDFRVLDLRVDDIDLERFCDVAPVIMIRMYLPRWMLIGRHHAFVLVELLSAPNWEQG